nr:MAG TPA: hypothetical protein [Caudoviricetes sp.]
MKTSELWATGAGAVLFVLSLFFLSFHFDEWVPVADGTHILFANPRHFIN